MRLLSAKHYYLALVFVFLKLVVVLVIICAPLLLTSSRDTAYTSITSVQEGSTNGALQSGGISSTVESALGQAAIRVLIDVQQTIVETFNTHSADIVFISDPFYASNFIGDGLRGYRQFYHIANTYGVDARMFVIIEPTLSSLVAQSVDENTVAQQFPVLSLADLWYIAYAKKVVVSPLLQYLAPRQYEKIVALRKANNKLLQTVTFNEAVQDNEYISVDYSKAMTQLGLLASELAHKKNREQPKIYAILDTKDSQGIASRLPYFLKSVHQHNPHTEMRYFWNTRTLDNEAITKSELESIPLDAVVLIDAGMHSYSVLSQYFDTYRENPQRIHDRILLVSYFSPEQLEYKIPVAASVYVPKDIFFQNIDNIHVVFSRLKK